ncbi:glycosyltransferase [uncultured Pseudoteredinibacter sp.]|uniref:glycosyltransferase n=1 Tax=uncultured Pseudoteredinibacter sp. TaxID=1641701 RepID=UPI00260EADEB|nr:glycosyltransferase [uncultured Pseudoteredinibacter sp.]
MQCPVDIIIPVYRGLEETIRCIEAAKLSLSFDGVRLIIVDDASPEEKISAYCRKQSTIKNIELISNTQNLGFVASVNKAMRSTDRDVVLLNSDTIVCNDWLCRIQASSYRSNEIATATPLSNNASICSVPLIENLYVHGEFPLERIDNVAAKVNKSVLVDVPTGVGFCMYIKREALELVGYFDEDSFGKGYGEENDFCMRCLDHGLRNIMAQDVFVHHEGEVSFSIESTKRKEAAERKLLTLHPHYVDEVEKYLQDDKSLQYKLRLLSACQLSSLLNNLKVERTVLHILGLDGGGSFRYVDSLVKELPKNIKHFALLISEAGCYLQDIETSVSLDLSQCFPQQQIQELLLEDLGFKNIHLHRLNEESIDLLNRIPLERVNLYITYHDLSFVSEGVFDDVAKKDFSCISDLRDDRWLDKFAEIRKAAKAIYFPSEYLKSVYEGLLGKSSVEDILCPDPPLQLKKLSSQEEEEIAQNVELAFSTDNKTIAIVGALGNHKGFEYFEQLKDLSIKSGGKTNWLHVGYSEKVTGKNVERNYIVTGAYEPDCLAAILSSYKVDLIYFPPGVPESYCYALSDVMCIDAPVIAHNRGALAERVSMYYCAANLLASDEAVASTLAFLEREGHSKRGQTESTLEREKIESYIEGLRMNISSKVDDENFFALQEQMKYFSVDQLPYRQELKKLADTKEFLQSQLKNSNEEIAALAEQVGEHRAWQEKLMVDIEAQNEAIAKLHAEYNELLAREEELKQELAGKAVEIEKLKYEFHMASYSIKRICHNLYGYFVRYFKERLKL